MIKIEKLKNKKEGVYMYDFNFELGDEVKDMVTGFKGVVRSRTQYLTGCNVYGIQKLKLDKEGNPQKWKHFDEPQMELIKRKKVVLKAVLTEGSTKTNTKKGGPNSSDEFAPSKD